MSDPSPGADPNDVTDARATMLAQHATLVQGGHSDRERERERARADLAAGGSIDWAAMSAEVNKALAAKLAEDLDALSADEPPPDDGAAAIPLDKVARYQELRAALAATEAEAKAIKEEADHIEAELVEAYAEAGMQSVNLNGKTVYLMRTTYAQRLPGVTAEDVKAALHASGAGDLITETVNAQTLNAWVRDLADGDDAPGLPEPAAAVLEVGERYAIRIRAAGRR